MTSNFVGYVGLVSKQKKDPLLAMAQGESVAEILCAQDFCYLMCSVKAESLSCAEVIFPAHYFDVF